jgi:hypothetical protein
MAAVILHRHSSCLAAGPVDAGGRYFANIQIIVCLRQSSNKTA